MATTPQQETSTESGAARDRAVASSARSGEDSVADSDEYDARSPCAGGTAEEQAKSETAFENGGGTRQRATAKIINACAAGRGYRWLNRRPGPRA
ncbi:hypothetical protein SETIT_3G292300v2 [Setaria italica]|uniref:Uncharacterized protein n=1 Tax=Setaria italica TaxID=4555 RepID=A0A368QM37_SETIT|nr:hypothetical protein SETIT_3G292300v2 [Setaria italica]